jgi:hypothetical protein
MNTNIRISLADWQDVSRTSLVKHLKPAVDTHLKSDSTCFEITEAQAYGDSTRFQVNVSGILNSIPDLFPDNDWISVSFDSSLEIWSRAKRVAIFVQTATLRMLPDLVSKKADFDIKIKLN